MAAPESMWRVMGTAAIEESPGAARTVSASARDRWLVRVGWSGLAAVGVYVFATVLGGILDPSYSHLRHPVSELTSSHAPDRWLLGGFYIAYNLILVVFAVGLFLTGRRSATLKVAFVFLIGTAVGGVLLVGPFPQDTMGQPGTTAGAMHIALAAVVSPLTVATTFLLGFASRRDGLWRGTSRFSLLMGLVILATGALAGITAVKDGVYLGLFQRVTIGAFLVWVLGLAAWALVKTRRVGEPDV